jgi:hypothetical protein
VNAGHSRPIRKYNKDSERRAPIAVNGGERGMKVRVVCYEGYRAEETPRAFLLGERRIEVVRVLDRWRGEDHEYVKLDGSDGARYILRYDRSRDEWEIQMMESPPSTA